MPKKRLKPWKTVKQLKTVKFTINKVGQKQFIEEGTRGRVYAGRIKFRNGQTKRVAIKVFKSGHKVNDEKAKKYKKVIYDLRKAGVKLPKMDMYYHPELKEWVKIMQLFGSSKKGSKLEEKSFFTLINDKERREALVELTKIANIGYYPASDLVEPFKNRKTGVIPFDIDRLVEEWKISPQKRAEKLLDNISLILNDKNTKRKQKEWGKYLQIVFQFANPTMKMALEREIKKQNIVPIYSSKRLLSLNASSNILKYGRDGVKIPYKKFYSLRGNLIAESHGYSNSRGMPFVLLERLVPLAEFKEKDPQRYKRIVEGKSKQTKRIGKAFVNEYGLKDTKKIFSKAGALSEFKQGDKAGHLINEGMGKEFKKIGGTIELVNSSIRLAKIRGCTLAMVNFADTKNSKIVKYFQTNFGFRKLGFSEWYYKRI